MTVLTDTHSLVWSLVSPHLLSPGARAALAEADVIASVANLWELCLKADKTNALLSDPVPWWNKYVVRTGIPALSIRAADVLTLADLPGIHKDPFDRILVAQALTEKIPLVTKDSRLSRYGVAVIW